MENCQYQEIIKTIEDDEDKFSWKYFSRQLFICSCIWSSYLLAGLTQGAVPVLIPQLRREANSSEAVTEEMASWITSTIAYSAAVWVIFMPVVSHYIGRKYTFLGSSFVVWISFISFYLNVSVAHLISTYFLQGLLLANNTTINLIMLTEYSSPKFRGVFLPIRTACVVWGMWIANAMGTFFHWKTIGLLAIILSFYNFVTAFFWVESPYWLASKGRLEECAKSHRWFRGTNKSSEEELSNLINFHKEYAFNNKDKDLGHHFFKRSWESMQEKIFYKSFLLCMLVLALYNFSGKMVFAMYAINIIKNITGDESKAYIGMLILDGVTVIGMYLGSILSRWIRRRTMLLTNSTVSVTFLFLTALYLYLIHMSFLEENTYVTLALLIGLTFSLSVGPFLLAACVFAELTPMKSRTLFTVLIGVYYNLIFGTGLKIAPMLFKTLNLYGAFTCYGVVTSVLIVLVKKYLPETKDKTVVEIGNIISGKKNRTALEKELLTELVQ